MGGTITGGKKAAVTNKQRYGESFYADIGAKGGVLGTKGGFYGDPESARQAGSKGGANSKRGYKLLKVEDGYNFFENRKTGEVVRERRRG